MYLGSSVLNVKEFALSKAHLRPKSVDPKGGSMASCRSIPRGPQQVVCILLAGVICFLCQGQQALSVLQILEPKYFFLRKTFKAKQIYFCHNLEANSLCDVCYSLNYTISKVLALHLTMRLWNHLICFGPTLLSCSVI